MRLDSAAPVSALTPPAHAFFRSVPNLSRRTYHIILISFVAVRRLYSIRRNRYHMFCARACARANALRARVRARVCARACECVRVCARVRGSVFV